MPGFNGERVYFPNLNGLRFFAALMVIIHHIEQFKSMYGLPNNFSSSTIQIFGELGVILFFVLSGFLITYLLLEEERQSGTILIRNFYVRRILRIWPLYFLIVTAALLVLPNIPLFVLPGYERAEVYSNLGGKILLYLFFLPNLVSPLFGIVPYASLTWSIGTEEQFYLTWPVLLKYIRKYRLLLMFMIILGYLFVARALYSSRTDFLPLKYELTALWSTFNIDCMAIGGFFAMLLHTKSRILKYFQNKYLFYFALALTSILLYRGIAFPVLMVNEIRFDYLYKEFYALWFGILILNFASNREILISLESRTLRHLGKISYGLYMYHPICIALVLNLLLLLKQTSDWLLYPLSLLTVILLAGISYKYFESYFLRFKEKYSIVASGEKVEKNGRSAPPEQVAQRS
jgi:peptidoglycan/LPS O-acetylase OafA/YrhL